MQTRLSAPMGSGRNVQISKQDEQHVFVPQPKRGRVAVVDLDSLQLAGEFDAGPAPAYLAEDAGMRVLLALSADGSSVTPVDEYGYRRLPTATVTGDPTVTIDGANRGRAIEYHVYGRSGIRYYKGDSLRPEERGTFDIDVGVAAGDGAKVTRSYVADRDHGVLYAIDSGRGGDGLAVVGRAQTSSGAPLAGRLWRLVHYSSLGLLDEADQRRFQSLCDRLRATSGLTDRFGFARPALPDPPVGS